MWHVERMVPYFPRPLICFSVTFHDRRFIMVNSRDASPMERTQEELRAEGASWNVSDWKRLLTSWPPAEDLVNAQEALHQYSQQMTNRDDSGQLRRQRKTPLFYQLTVL